MNTALRACYLFKTYQRALERAVVLVGKHSFPKWECFRHTHSSSDNSVLRNVINCDINDLTNGDEALEKKLKVLVLEVDIWRQEGERIPSHLKPGDWKELITLNSRNARKKFLMFCWKREIKKRNEKEKKTLERVKRFENSEEKKSESSELFNYGLGHNSMFMRIRETTMNNFFNSKLIEAMQFSQELVVDCGYDQHMTRREARNCGKQLGLLFAENRMHVNPFNLYFCSAQRGSESMLEFGKIINTAYEPHFPLNITEKSYLELFPKDRLVYLTPHCREELIEYDHNAVYIIGGLVDKVNSAPLSLARAKEQNLKMAQLPLNRFLAWGTGSGKSLTLNQMIMILLDLRLTGDWKKALQHVPSRKIQKMYQIDYSSNRFKLAGNYKGQTQCKDAYNDFVLNRYRKKV